MASDTRADRSRHGARHGRRGRLPIHVRTGREHDALDTLAAAIDKAAAGIEQTLPATLVGISFTIEDVPTAAELRAVRSTMPLGRQVRGNPSTVTLYRRPIEARCADDADVDRLVRDTVAELVGALAGVSPTRVCPQYGQ